MTKKIQSVLHSRRAYILLVALLFLLGFLVRLYRFDGPIADWHSWRQSDTSAVSRIFAQRGFDVLHPRYLDISNIQTGLNNPEGYRFVEFPLYNVFQAAPYVAIGVLTIEEWGRVITIISSLLTAFFLYKLCLKHFSKSVALFSIIFYLFIPFSIYYGRAILPDTAMIMASFGGIYFFDLYLSKKGRWRYGMLFVAFLFTASSFLLKPYGLFFVLPQIVLAYQKYKTKMFLRPELYLYAVLSVLPLAAWRYWIMSFPEGVPASTWLLNGNGIRFRPAFFKWMVFERFTKLIGGYSAVVFALIGVWAIIKTKESIFAASFLLSSLLYVFIFATGNVQHDYYQILIVPSIALLFAFGAAFMWSKGLVAKVVTVCLIIASFYFSGTQVKDYFNINNRALVIAGMRADQVLPKNAKVIAPYNGDTTFLYYINRPGWPAMQDSPEKLKELGATHMVIVSPSENDFSGFGKTYSIVDASKDYLILEL